MTVGRRRSVSSEQQIIAREHAEVADDRLPRDAALAQHPDEAGAEVLRSADVHSRISRKMSLYKFSVDMSVRPALYGVPAENRNEAIAEHFAKLVGADEVVSSPVGEDKGVVSCFAASRRVPKHTEKGGYTHSGGNEEARAVIDERVPWSAYPQPVVNAGARKRSRYPLVSRIHLDREFQKLIFRKSGKGERF